MTSIQEEQKGRWSVYFVTIALGLAFSITLLSITWNNALERNKREFTLESFALRESIARNVRTAHNVTNNFSAFFKANPDLNEQQFTVFTETLLQQHEFIEGAFYFPILSDDDRPLAAGGVTFPDHYQVMRDGSYFQEKIDLYKGDYKDAVETTLEGENVLTLTEDGNEMEGKKYWMFKGLDAETTYNSISIVSNNHNKRALVAILVDTSKLFGNTVSDTELALTMISNASSLSTRQLLYHRTAVEEDIGWGVASLKEEGLTQFPSYSIRMTVSKELGWEEVDKELVFNALLIGVGVTLLIIALVRAKDQQSKELKERNIVIERQVSEQTKELAKARDQALEASQVKSEFFS